MGTRNTGGAAFPELGNTAYQSDWQSESGMTLRDYFAAKAMQAIIQNNPNSICDIVSKASYYYADAMIAERDK